ncbi:hypothetical protein ACFYN0_26465 [Streptomyces sp. NPDC006704]|uniref:hypothetical protein n=1 Tax=Streptomyces sp. NPDC006704 TaxID=3364760 RepID=UPI00368C738B
MLGQPYRVELNRDIILDLWRCGPCVLELEADLLRDLQDDEPGDRPRSLRSDGRVLKPLRVKLIKDTSGVLATAEDIRQWFVKLLETSPEQLTDAQQALIRSWPEDLQGRIGRVPDELVVLWQTLRPELAASSNVVSFPSDQVFRGLRQLLVDDPAQFSKAERSMIMDLQKGDSPPLAVVTLYARCLAAQQKVKRP